jgi:hypothetical protein
VSFGPASGIPPERQLVLEITVTNILRSTAFYRSMGFSLIRAEERFAEVGWETADSFWRSGPNT